MQRSAQDAKVTPLMSKDLAEFPGKEGLMITVVYPPGASDPIHRHNAYAFLYVLEGSVVMQLKGGKEITLAPGQTTRRIRRRASSTSRPRPCFFRARMANGHSAWSARAIATRGRRMDGRRFRPPT